MMSFLGASLIAVLVFLIIGVSARLLAVASDYYVQDLQY